MDGELKMFSDGRILIIFGGLLLLLGLFTDTTVSSPIGDVHNLGLIAQKQNSLILGGIMLVGGMILKAYSQKSSSNNHEQASPSDKKESTLLKATLTSEINSFKNFLRSMVVSVFFGAIMPITLIIFLITVYDISAITCIAILLSLFITSILYMIINGNSAESAINVLKLNIILCYTFIIYRIIDFFIFEIHFILEISWSLESHNREDLLHNISSIILYSIIPLIVQFIYIKISKYWIRSLEKAKQLNKST